MNLNQTHPEKSFPSNSIFWGVTCLLVTWCVFWTWIGQSFLAYNQLNDADSSYFVYGGTLINKGLSLYVDFWDQKPPGIFYQNALLLKLFGFNFKAFAIAQGFVVLAMLYFVTHALKNLLSQAYLFLVVACLAYAFNLNNYFDYGNRPEFLMCVFECAAFCCAILYFQKRETKFLIFLGALSALAFCFKPVGMASYLAMSAFLLAWESKGRKLKPWLFLNLGMCFVLIPLVIFYMTQGHLGELLKATFFIPIQIAEKSPYSYFEIIERMFFAYGPIWGIVWPMALCPFFIFSKKISSKEKQVLVFSVLFLLASLCGILVQKHGFPHYYHQGVAPLCFLSVLCLYLLSKELKNYRIKNFFLIGFLCLSFVLTGWWSMKRQIIYYQNLDQHADKNKSHLQLGKWLITRLKENETIYYWSHGYMPYLLSDRVSPGRLTPLFLAKGEKSAEFFEKDFARVQGETSRVRFLIESLLPDSCTKFFIREEGLIEGSRAKAIFETYKIWKNKNYEIVRVPFNDFRVYEKK